MEFKEQLPVWQAEGVAPPETIQNEGWKVGDRPPADIFNWLHNRTYTSLEEIREKMNWLADNSGKVETVNNVKPDSNKNIKLTGANIPYRDGVTENIATKISKMDTEIDTVKQSGVKSNKRISDKLNSLEIPASDKDSISTNVGKFENIPNHGSLNKTITTQNGKQIITSGYYEGGEVKAQFNNLTPGNIKDGVNIGGVLGNYAGEILMKKGTVTLGFREDYNIPYPGFTPNFVIIEDDRYNTLIKSKITNSSTDVDIIRNDTDNAPPSPGKTFLGFASGSHSAKREYRWIVLRI